MGRPLYSSAFKTTPAVRDPEPPSFEKWSYLNAFDPDSDEFFDNENAVYEDFIVPVTAVNPEEEEEEDERDMLVVRMGNASPITSESSLSDSESPLAVGAEDRAHLVVDAFHDIRQIEEAESALVEPAVRVRLATRAPPGQARWVSQTTDSPNGRLHPRRGFATTAAIRNVSYVPYPQRFGSLPVPAPSAPIPVPAVSRRSVTVDERALPSPSTPPRQTTHIPMSPPPTSTPRLYSWARNPSHTASPSSGGPFTNPHARTSYAHLSPALVRIRDVTV
ncbi:hypothetical protein J3R83DRAFT_8507 [Lanmaoa asiatica]|nr:hypothetical protein J3R83DRAFT_8507 [Lanmaoa asiatica]